MAVWTAYQGIEVVDSDPKVPCRHPRYGYDKLSVLPDASLLMLADGTMLVVCDEPECGFNGLTGRDPYVKPEGEYRSIVKQADSVLSHKSGTHWQTTGRRTSSYSDDEIRAIIKIFLKWKSTRILNWTTAACIELGNLGFKTSRGKAWSPDILSSVVRHNMKKPQFANIKAGPLSEPEKEAISDLVRQAAGRVGSKSSVAATARITERKPPYQHTPVDFAKIIEEQAAAEQPEPEKEAAQVPPTNGPTLSFSTSQSDDLPTRTLNIGEPPRPTVEAAVARAASTGDFEYIDDLPDGSPMFRYRGVLMVGKAVKGVEI